MAGGGGDPLVSGGIGTRGTGFTSGLFGGGSDGMAGSAGTNFGVGGVGRAVRVGSLGGLFADAKKGFG